MEKLASLHIAEIFSIGHMERHQCEGGSQVKMVIMRIFRNSLSRQVSEAVSIEMGQVDLALNSKAEWNSQRIPRLVLEVGARVIQADH